VINIYKEKVLAANRTVSMSALYRCSFKEAWGKYLPDYLKEDVSYGDVEEYINEKIELGRTV
jgi:hypothetical protein